MFLNFFLGKVSIYGIDVNENPNKYSSISPPMKYKKTERNVKITDVNQIIGKKLKSRIEISSYDHHILKELAKCGLVSLNPSPE